MAKIINIKYTKNLDNFIINSLPYLELFLKETNENIFMYANEYVCEILELMFDDKYVRTQKIKNTFNLPENTIELDEVLSDFYPAYYTEIASKNNLKILPLNPPKNNYLEQKKYICIFPKFSMKDKQHTFTTQMLDELFKKINFNKIGYEIYIIGNTFEKVNSKYGKDIENFKDIVSALKNCNLFITSESHWKYIALLCNCRNIIVYNTNSRELNEFEKYNPYNNNIFTTNNILNDETIKKIQEII